MTHPGRDAFPRQQARTRRFTLGVPRAWRVRSDGRGVLFLRAAGPEDPTTLLWALDLPAEVERLLLDPRDLDVDEGALPEAERARRERVREGAGGIVAYATDAAGDTAVTAVGGVACVVDVASGAATVPPLPGPVSDPRVDPTGHRLAWVRDGALWVADVDGQAPRELASEDDPAVSWGLAEFVAAEEMGRTRGYWWAPDGARLLAARVDTSPVAQWHLADPAQPWAPPTTVAYPAAGGRNADVSLAIVELGGQRTPVEWDRDTWPYLARVDWRRDPPLLAVQTRDQRRLALLDVDPATGSSSVRGEVSDPHWVELVGGLPRRLPDGRVLHSVDDGDVRRLAVDGRVIGPAHVHVRSVAGLAEGAAYVAAAEDDPAAVVLWRIPLDGDRAAERVSGAEGVHTAAVGRGVTVTVARRLDDSAAHATVAHEGGRARVASLAATPVLPARPRLAQLGPRELQAALVLPHGREPGDGALPVLLDPYGGPHAQRVLQAGASYGPAQWFAEQGYAVLIVDGRGSPGRGAAWERAVAGDLASVPLADQADALHAAAGRWPNTLDLARVAIRGWSFGGYLAALAVLRRPAVFHAAIAGAPVTDWRWYDTHYTERYLGHPDRQPQAYERSSLLPHAGELTRPLLLIHGLADDNVVAAHTLQLSAALLAHARPHRVLPLSGVTHMTPQESIAESLLVLQQEFLAEALAAPASGERRAGGTVG